MAEFEKNGLLVKSRFDGADQIITVSAHSRKTLVPAFAIHLRSIVENMNIGRHSVDITVGDIAALVRSQRTINRSFIDPYNFVNNLDFVFGRDADIFALYRDRSGDKAGGQGEIKLGQGLYLYRPGGGEDITASVTPILAADPYGDGRLLFTVITGSNVKTLSMPRDLKPFVGKTPGDGTSTPPEYDLAEYIDFTYTK